MKRSFVFAALLLIQTLIILVYTLYVFQAEGADLLSVFVSQVKSLTWAGQFNLDFLCYLTLSGFWIMWRDKFSFRSVPIGLMAMVLGILFFAPYLLWLLLREKGEIKRVLTGDR